MRELQTYFLYSANQTLYHYTGIDSLLSIVNNRSLRASNARYVNDAKEISYACEILDKMLNEVIQKHDGEERVLLKKLQNIITSLDDDAPIFVFSLSEERNLLSQWRGYTPQNKGVSIGFPAELINDVMKKHSFEIVQCLYDANEHKKLLESLIYELLRSFRSRTNGRVVDESFYSSLLEEFRAPILRVSVLIKHPAFKEEREWRLISRNYKDFSPPKIIAPEVKFREGASTLTPYVEMKLPDSGLLFEEVILGPSANPKLSIQSLRAYLNSQKACNSDSVVDSEIPLRKW